MSLERRAVDPTELAFTPAGRTAAGTVFTCALCGRRFDHGGLVCAACPLRAGCDVVRCPHCGFQFPRTSHAVEWVRRLFGRRRSDRT